MWLKPRPTADARQFAKSQNFREVGLHQCPSERKGQGVPVRSLRVPSHLPSHPRTAAKVRGFSLTAWEFTAETDWLLEGDGFELSVPRNIMRPVRRCGRGCRAPGGSRDPLRQGWTSIAPLADSRRLTLRLAVEGSPARPAKRSISSGCASSFLSRNLAPTTDGRSRERCRGPP